MVASNTTCDCQLTPHRSDRGIQRVLEVAAANEAAVKRLVGMMDDFDRRLRVLERQSPQTESQVYESILNGRYRLPGNC